MLIFTIGSFHCAGPYGGYCGLFNSRDGILYSVCGLCRFVLTLEANFFIPEDRT
jgi:hypothetical protein